jgi:hypothetical protein
MGWHFSEANVSCSGLRRLRMAGDLDFGNILDWGGLVQTLAVRSDCLQWLTPAVNPSGLTCMGAFTAHSVTEFVAARTLKFSYSCSLDTPLVLETAKLSNKGLAHHWWWSQ